MRSDLLNLTPEAVVALCNRGLVNRALKEIAEGKGPVLTEEPDGTIVARVQDMGKEVISKLLPGKTLKDCSCTCGAIGVCRHRVAAVLAYPSFVAAGESSEKSAPEPDPYQRWSPGIIDEETLQKALGDKTYKKALTLKKKGMVVDIRFPSQADNVGTARLPSCTVRFFGSSDLTCAKCDCQLGSGCEHVAMAVWGFQEQPDLGDRLEFTVQIGDISGSTRGKSKAVASDLVSTRDVSQKAYQAMAVARGLLWELLADGVANARPSLGQKFALVQQGFEGSGCVWPGVLLQDIEALLGAYRSGSALYEAGEVVAGVAELEARRRAMSGRGEQPGKYVLGEGEKLETSLEMVQLIGIGARLLADQKERRLEIFFVNPDTSELLVLKRTLSFPDATPPLGPEISNRSLAGSLKIGILARGMLKTYSAIRRANREVTFRTAKGKTEAAPASRGWEDLPVPVRIESLADWRARLESRPPRLIRPRLMAEDMHVVRVTAVGACSYNSGEQQLWVELFDGSGASFWAVRDYRSVAPLALEVMLQALLGKLGTVHYVSGELTQTGGRVVLSLVAIQVEVKAQVKVIVPDLEFIKDPPGLPELPTHAMLHPISQTLKSARSVLEEAIQVGFRGINVRWADHAEQIAQQLKDLGMAGMALRMNALVKAWKLEHAAGGTSLFEKSAQAFEDLAVRLLLAEELGG